MSPEHYVCQDSNCHHYAAVHKKKKCTVKGCRCKGLKLKGYSK